MRKKSHLKAYLIFSFVILCLISIPIRHGGAIKGAISELINPLWRLLAWKGTSQNEAEALKLEKLHAEVRELSLENRRLLSALKESRFNLREKKPSGDIMSAKVIYRSPLFWSNFLIIDAGENLNLEGKEVIAKGSPVIFQGALVGVVDYVGKKMSRVRLLSDESLHPSVRVARGRPKENELLSLVEKLLIGLSDKELASKLEAFKGQLLQKSDPLFLAKGILQGKGQPLWRSSGHELKGIGFNYDFSDEEGPARELITGKAEDQQNTLPLALIKEGDLLVTSGLDGVFPEGIPVAFVKSVDKLKEGDFCFSLKAVPCIDNLNYLTDVFILPSLNLHQENSIQLP